MSELQNARVEPRPARSWTRALPILALVVAALLLRRAWQERGPLVRIHATDGHGLAAGDALRTRGIEVGRVESLELASDGVVIEARLARSAAALARAGTRFWIARPILSVEGVHGLETALGSRYVGVLAGAPSAPHQHEFTALEEPPLLENEACEGREFVLEARVRGGLAPGAPLLFRGFAIGAVLAVGLASDAATVEVRVHVHAPYLELVRTNSRFFRARGAEWSLGLGGLEVAIESLPALWLGGVVLATPTEPGALATAGARFEVADEPEKEWLAWRPALALGAPSALSAPRQVWAELRWKPRAWFARAKTRAGWLIAEEGGWLGPEDLLSAPADAEPESVALECAGERLDLAAAPSWSAGGLARRADAAARSSMPLPASRALTESEDLLLLGDRLRAPLALSQNRLARVEGGLEVASSVPLEPAWHGALAFARSDGAWVGVLLWAEGRGRIVPPPPPR